MPIFSRGCYGGRGGDHRVFFKPDIFVTIWVTAIFSRCWAWNPGLRCLASALSLSYTWSSIPGLFHAILRSALYIDFIYLWERGKYNYTEFLKMAFLFPNYEPNSAEIINSKWCPMSEEVSKMQREHRVQRGHPPHLMTYLSFVFL